MGDDDQRGPVEDQLLELLDGADVEMVGGLVEQQQVRLERERQRERGALGLSAGKALRIGIGIEGEPLEVLDDARLHMPVAALVGMRQVGHAGALHQRIEQRVRRIEDRLLFDRDDAQRRHA